MLQTVTKYIYIYTCTTRFPPTQASQEGSQDNFEPCRWKGKWVGPRLSLPRSVDAVDGRNIANKLRLVVDIPLFTGF